MKTELIITGGFLAAGKTSLLFQAASILMKQGKKVGIITNDQAADLVDTHLLKDVGLKTCEVTGSCFCCNFNGFINAIESLRAQGAEIILAEPVGSCTDLVSTIIRPLKKFHAQDYQLMPLTVLTEPARMMEMLCGSSPMHADAQYIWDIQIQEADILAISKADLLTPEQRAPLLEYLEKTAANKPVMFLSSKVPEMPNASVSEWLKIVRRGSEKDSTSVPVDYDRYAHGEAVLGWLNAAIQVHWTQPPQSEKLLKVFLEQLKNTLQELKAPIGHIKTVLYDEDMAFYANIAGSSDEISLQTQRGDYTSGNMIFNARVQMSPAQLEELVRALCVSESIQRMANMEIHSLRCFQPGRPNPTYRL